MFKIQNLLPVGRFWDISLSVMNTTRRLGYWPNYRKPSTFNEYFLWHKANFNCDMALARTLTDKIFFKDWLKDNGFGDYIIPTIFVATSVSDLRNRLMPRSCVIKPTHSSGDVIILRGAQERCLNDTEILKISRWFEEDYYLRGREPNYRNLMPRVIVEELLLDESGQPVRDYKIECAAGEPFMVQVDIDRFSAHVRQLYTVDWELLPYCTSYSRFPDMQIRPPQLDLALNLARKLASPFLLCRIDLYFLGNDEVRIGEVTFFPANCAEVFLPRSGDNEAGKLIGDIFKQKGVVV